MSIPGPICQVLNWLDIDDGTTCRTASPKPGPAQAPAITAHEDDTGVSGKVDGVGPDIVSYLEEVGEFFEIRIVVTSGKRDPDAQANAMYDNWIKLERGRVYAKVALPEKNRAAMDGYYKIAEESSTASDDEKDEAKEKFLELGRLVKSRHSARRAVDIWLKSLSPQARHALALRMNEVKEGSRTDIIHVESTSLIPAVDENMRKRWKTLRDGQHPRAAHTPASSNNSDGCHCE